MTNLFRKDDDLVATVRAIMEKKHKKDDNVDFDKDKKGELDDVDKKQAKGDFDDREDKDIDNDGNTDDSDEYLHKRRKAVTKAVEKEEVEFDEAAGGTKASFLKKYGKRKSGAYTRPGSKKEKRAASKAVRSMNEEADLEETSNRLKGSYIRAAAADMGKSMKQYGAAVSGAINDKDGSYKRKKLNDYSKRQQGINRATRMMAREDVDVIEAYEQLDEISKKALANYIKKSTGSVSSLNLGASRAIQDAMRMAKQKDANEMGKASRAMADKANRRQRYQSKAVDRLAKEEVEDLDEISQGMKGRYIRSASTDLAAASPSLFHPDASEKEKKWASKVYAKRHKGINRATRKMVNNKEEYDVIEDFEQLDEISKKALSNYIKAAHRDATTTQQYRWEGNKRKKSKVGRDAADRAWDKKINRRRGIHMAANKLAREEVEDLEEISKKTMSSYAQKALAQHGKASADGARSITNKRNKGIERLNRMLFKKLDKSGKK